MIYKLDYRLIKIILAFLMIVVLLLSLSVPSHAFVGVESILIPSVIAALESWGISTEVSGLDGQEIAQWFHEKLTDWSTYAGIALENIVTGIKMTPLGQVLLNPVASMAIKDFAGWFVQQNNLSPGGSPVQVISGGFSFNGFPVYEQENLYYTSSYPYYLRTEFKVTDGYCFASGGWVYAVADHAGASYQFTTYFADGTSSASPVYSMTEVERGVYYGTFRITNVYGAVDPDRVSYTFEQLVAASGGVQSVDGSMNIVPTSSMDVPSTSELQDKEYLMDTGLDVGADAAAWYDSVMAKVAANDMTVTGTIVDAGTITADQVIPQEGITDVDGTVTWPEVTVPIGVSGLDEIFPFCIPFDVYHFFEALAADPVAPDFELPFLIDGLVDYTFEIDLSDFDQVAQVLRTVELLAFCVGLAFVTRNHFIRG